jgi:hypothetical protein
MQSEKNPVLSAAAIKKEPEEKLWHVCSTNSFVVTGTTQWFKCGQMCVLGHGHGLVFNTRSH